MADSSRRDARPAVPEPPIVSTMPSRMSTLDASNRTGPLTPEEAQQVDRAARRLHEQFRTLLGRLPHDARNASGLARYLGVDRTTCQRLVYTATRPYPGVAAVERLPGVRGMRQLVDAARASPSVRDEDALESLITAIDRFDEVVRSTAGSQSALIRRINATPMPGESQSEPGDDPEAARRRLFEAAAELTGRYSESWLAVYIYQPGGGDDGRQVDVTRAHGLVGHVARSNAIPLTFHNFSTPRRDDPDEVDRAFHSLSEGRTSGRTPDSVLTAFSSDPPPVVSSRQPGEYLVQAIDIDPGEVGRPVDLMLATRNTVPHPATQPSGIEEVWAMINFPARWMVFDVYLHRELARACIPGIDAHLWRPDFTEHVGDRWQTRFANGPRLDLLGQGIEHAATPAYARHAELTHHMFSRLGVDPQRYVGYRCAVEYPIWRTGYCMSFDFNASDE